MTVVNNDVVIARGGKPEARLTRLTSSKRKLKFGVLKGKIKVSAGFDAPLTADSVRAACGGAIEPL